MSNPNPNPTPTSYSNALLAEWRYCGACFSLPKLLTYRGVVQSCMVLTPAELQPQPTMLRKLPPVSLSSSAVILPWPTAGMQWGPQSLLQLLLPNPSEQTCPLLWPGVCGRWKHKSPSSVKHLWVWFRLVSSNKTDGPASLPLQKDLYLATRLMVQPLYLCRKTYI